MSAIIPAYNGTFANMAAIETEFQANWVSGEFMRGMGANDSVFIHTDLAVGQKLRLFVRASRNDGTAVWSLHPDGEITITAAMRGTTDGSDWPLLVYDIGQEWSGLVVSTDAAASVILRPTGLP